MDGCYHGEITIYHPPCSHAQQEEEHVRDEERRRGFMMDSLGARGLGSSAGPRAQRASERALVIWSARQLGLSSETLRGEVGDHV